jgi:pimeloyl-ACP methyl ester carboxylesterase
MTGTSHRVVSTDGVSLAVHESGRPDGPVVVAVHGYPDNHHVWDGVAARLGGEFRVVAYDVRGTGDSDKPARVADYRMPRLVDDLVCVLDAVSPDRAVHLVAHDWGSIQCWPALTDPRLAGRIAGFTSISGPSIDHAGSWLRKARHHPWAAARQLAHSTYILLFQLPVLPELAIRRGLFERLTEPASYRTRADELNGLKLYRANMVQRTSRPRPALVTIPVQLVVLDQDAFVTPELAVGAPGPWVADLTVRHLPAEHWVVSAQPELVADLVREFAGQVGRPSSSSVPSHVSK